MFTDAKFVALLCREARQAVVAHAEDVRENPDRHRGCLWCYDGRLSHWASDMGAFYDGRRDGTLEDGRSVVDAALDLYDRAYRGANRAGNIF